MMITAIVLQSTTIVYLVIVKKTKDDNKSVIDNREKVNDKGYRRIAVNAAPAVSSSLEKR